ncbi:MAG TPA: cytochrome c-type biogenesis protein CcmH [Candidatus Eisenbacteria bacterium]|jgi:cytochrome c-type biogenesis protein CcmH|nr:cytochrome c-type biogenesis protein CcmH [Candidatus Eisenbacteria bacterium]
MQNRKAKIGLLALLPLLLMAPVAQRLLADQNDRAHKIGDKLKCMCGGCDQSAAKCYHVGGTYSGPCDTAKSMLKEIDAHVAQGKSDEQALQAMITEYGPLAYLEPPKSGFGLVAWLMPILYLLGGTGLVIVIMKRWRKRPAAIAGAAMAAGAGGSQATVNVTPELLARARDLARRETED